MTVPGPSAAPTLSFCITTRNRAEYIGATLASLLDQSAGRDVEIVVVDGASTDGTPDVVAAVAVQHPAVRLFRETENSGLDGDYDKAVGYARGTYCWLMSDDDLLEPGALATVLAACEHGPTLVVANARIYDVQVREVLEDRRLRVQADRVYAPGMDESLFTDVADYLTFLGGVVMRREEWLRRERRRYYGSWFVHVGVIFQAPLPHGAIVLARPLISIRYGNASWAASGFEIWMRKWPDLVWSFEHFSTNARAQVVAREPWRRPALLLLHRALGGYDRRRYGLVVRPQRPGLWLRFVAVVIATMPGALAARLVEWHIRYRRPDARMTLLDLSNGPFARRGQLVSRHDG
jgi:glycosyltransferase involved in cell wall biosynthesis